MGNSNSDQPGGFGRRNGNGHSLPTVTRLARANADRGDPPPKYAPSWVSVHLDEAIVRRAVKQQTDLFVDAVAEGNLFIPRFEWRRSDFGESHIWEHNFFTWQVPNAAAYWTQSNQASVFWVQFGGWGNSPLSVPYASPNFACWQRYYCYNGVPVNPLFPHITTKHIDFVLREVLQQRNICFRRIADPLMNTSPALHP